MKLSQIKPNPANPRIIKDEAFQKLCKSIQEFPKMMELRPIVTDASGMVLGGNMRLKALQHLGKIMNDNLSKKQFEDFIKGFISNILIGIKEGASIYICCNWKDSYPRFYFNLQDAGINISANIIWNKGSAGMGWQDYRYQYEFIIYGFKIGAKHNWYGGRTQTDVWDFSRDNTIDYNHPTQKPIKLSSQAINNSSKSEDLILDLFLGSGSTMVAAHQLSRKCYGMELDPKYCQVIIDRMRKLDPNIKITKNGQPYA